MEQIYELKKKLLRDLGDYSKRDLSTGSLDVVYKMASTVKNLCKIIDSEDGDSYSRRMSYARGYVEPGRDEYSYDGMSRRGRDSMGRYTRDSGLMHKLQALADEAQDEKTRREIEGLMRRMEQ